MKKTKEAKPKPTKSVNFAEDSSEARTPSTDELVQVAALTQRMLQLVKAMEEIDLQREKLNDEFERIRSADLPGLMESIGLKTFTLSTGETVNIKPIIKGNLPTELAILKEKDKDKQAELRDRFEQGIAFLQERGAGALIKNCIEAELGKGSEKLAAQAIVVLNKLGIDPVNYRAVNSNSLNAWLSEQLAQGAEIDPDLFKLYSGSRAEVKQVKRDSLSR
jgi:hypothetical protein